MRTITHASLFSGIGGAEIAAAWLGWENLFHCDINEFGRKVLGYWFPQSKEYNDIKTTDFTEWRGRVGILTAGFPCQPFSLAGKRKGADDDRYLWPETLRAINEIRPAWFVGENVFGIASMVLPGEEVDMGRTDDLFDEGNLYRTERRFVLDRICRDIEDAGYTVQPVVIPACAVGAPHRRDRVWFVARRKDDGTFADTEGYGSRGVAGTQGGAVGRQDTELDAEPIVNGEPLQGRREEPSGCESGEARTADFSGYGHARPAAHASCGECEALEEMPGVEGGRGRDLLLQGGRGDEAERTGGLAGVQRADAVTCVAGLQKEGAELKAAGASGTLSQVDADSNGDGLLGGHGEDEVITGEGRVDAFGDAGEGGEQSTAHACRGRLEETDERRPTEDDGEGLRGDVLGERRIPRSEGWEGFPTQPPVCRGDDGLPFGVADLTLPFGKWRKEAIKALGNAWVPEVAYEIFRMIQEVENGTDEQQD